jgi:Fe-S cluster assembly protein SufD|tara:strand:- start:48 stop:1274 length:1227 start_codon:yes stop_codon:yes gene_type:complete
MLKENQDLKKIFSNITDNISAREKHFNQFLEDGFPSKRIEDWKFSDLNSILDKNLKGFKFGVNSPNKNINENILLKDFDHSKIFLTNGDLSYLDIHEDDKNKFDVISENLLFDDKISQNSLNNLNKALSNKLTKIKILEGKIIEKPIIIYNDTTSNNITNIINARSKIILEKNSSVTILNLFYNKINDSFINLNFDFDIKENSNFKNYVIDLFNNDNCKYSFTNINIAKNGYYENFIYSAGSKYSRNEINCNLNENYSSAFINGIININDNKHHEIKTNINHLSENTKSHQLIKSVLNDQSNAAYQGKIFVEKEAQKTDGYQLSRALLLDQNTEFNAKPELEIYADDVKCSHGSTSGNLDQNAIFYLMSRGIGYVEAKKLLIDGFINDVIEKITNKEVKNYIKGALKL